MRLHIHISQSVILYTKRTVRPTSHKNSSIVLLEKLTGPQSGNSPHFMEAEDLLQHSEQPATCLHSEPDKSSS